MSKDELLIVLPPETDSRLKQVLMAWQDNCGPHHLVEAPYLWLAFALAAELYRINPHTFDYIRRCVETVLQQEKKATHAQPEMVQ